MSALMPEAGWIRPDWPAPPDVRALITTRAGGVSEAPYGVAPGTGQGLNLGLGAGDDPAAVLANRARLRAVVGDEPRWLRQVHAATVVDAATVFEPVAADASYTDISGVVAGVMIADCMPVLLTDTSGRCVGVAHAGWRGLAAGVIQATVRAMRERIGDPAAELLAYLGPAIGPKHFEVGAEVMTAMREGLPRAADAFVACGNGKYFADLFALGRQALAQIGVSRIYGGGDCTYSDAQRFYSYRRDGVTGRHAAVIWKLRGSDPASLGLGIEVPV
jgi:YfiH family protein